MNFKEYKERQEAKAYFRSQGSYYLDNATLIKNAGIGICVGIGVGICYGLLKTFLPINFSILIIGVGYIVSYLIQQLVNHRNVQMAIISVVSTLIALIVSNIVSMYFVFYAVALPYMIVNAIVITFSSIITDLYILVSCILAYKMNE